MGRALPLLMGDASVKFTPEQKKAIDEIVTARLAREQRRHDAQLQAVLQENTRLREQLAHITHQPSLVARLRQLLRSRAT